MLTQAANLLDTIPPAICLATSLLGAVTKAMENSPRALLELAIPAMLDTWLGKSLNTVLRI